MDFVERLESTTAEELFERKVNYHDKCYSSFASVNKLDRARKRFAESINIGESSVVKRKKGWPSLTGETTDNDNKIPRTRSKAEKYDKTMCIICQKPDGHTCKVAFKETGKTVLSVAQKLSDKTFFIRLNTITHADDAIAKDVLYHNLCWEKAKRLAKQKPKSVENYAKRWQILNC